MPVMVAVVAQFHPVSYGGFIRFSFVLVLVSKAFGDRICFTKVSLFDFQSKIYLITPDFGDVCHINIFSKLPSQIFINLFINKYIPSCL